MQAAKLSSGSAVSDFMQRWSKMWMTDESCPRTGADLPTAVLVARLLVTDGSSGFSSLL